jgi:hypothetical protein
MSKKLMKTDHTQQIGQLAIKLLAIGGKQLA